MHILVILLLGLAAGILVGLMGIGGGTIVVPALVYLLGMTQHMAQGTSLFMQLLPVGLGALWVYWKAGEGGLRAGSVWAVGMLVGGYGAGAVEFCLSLCPSCSWASTSTRRKAPVWLRWCRPPGCWRFWRIPGRTR